MIDVTAERWLPIPGYEGFYEASDMGRIRSLPRKFANSVAGRVLKPWQKKDGHLMVALCVNSRPKSFLVHRLVALAFIGPQPPDHEVCHGDGDPANNRADNLRWDTRSANIKDSVRHGTNAWASKTHCPQGHPYDEENTVTGNKKNGGQHRLCRICTREHKRQSDKRRRQARRNQVEA